jgi:coenzyme F420 hydrogenase subunit beta
VQPEDHAADGRRPRRRPRRRPLTLDEIVQAGLCIGCGLCQSLAGPDRVALVRTTEGRERPIVRRELDHATLELINDVCPGVRVDGADLGRVPAGAAVDRIWGPAARLAITHATDPELRYVAASGGVLTALAEHLLNSGEVEFVVHVAPRLQEPMRSGPHVSIDRSQLLRAAGSRYGPAAPLIDFCEVLERGRPFAFIGKPCDVTAIRSLARHDPRVDAHLRCALTMVCGGASELIKSRALLTGFGVDERELRTFRYRGHGNPGLTHLETVDGDVHELTYNEMWEDEGTWRLQSRCKICPDALGEGADLVAADCWEDAEPTGEDEGFNAVLVRTNAGLEIFDAAVRDGVLTVDREIGFRDMDRFQPHQVVKKESVWARLIGMRVAGSPVLRTRGLRLRTLALRRSPIELAREVHAAYRRVGARRLSEGPPVPERGSVRDSLVPTGSDPRGPR